MKRHLHAEAGARDKTARRRTKLSLSKTAAIKGPDAPCSIPAGPDAVAQSQSSQVSCSTEAHTDAPEHTDPSGRLPLPPPAFAPVDTMCQDHTLCGTGGRDLVIEALLSNVEGSTKAQMQNGGDGVTRSCTSVAVAHDLGSASAAYGNTMLAGIEEIAETDEDEGFTGASPPPLGSQHDEGEGGDCIFSTRLYAETTQHDQSHKLCAKDVEQTETAAERKGAGSKQGSCSGGDRFNESVGEHVCMLCGLDLSGQDLSSRERHLNSCLDQSHEEGACTRKEVQGLGYASEKESSQFQCAICSENMMWWSEEQRSVHMNQCCDAMLQANSAFTGDALCSGGERQKGHEIDEEDEAFKKIASGAGAEGSGVAGSAQMAKRSVRQVLRQMGLEKHADSLHNADVKDLSSLGRLPEGEMRQLGLSVGARKRLLAGQAALRAEGDAAAANNHDDMLRAVAGALPVYSNAASHVNGDGNQGSNSRGRYAFEHNFSFRSDVTALDLRATSVETPSGVSVCAALRSGGGGEVIQPRERKLKRVGQEIRDAVPEGRERKGFGKGTGSAGPGLRLAASVCGMAQIGGGGGTSKSGAVGAKSKRKQLLLTGTRGGGAISKGGGRSEGEECSQVALAMALSASVEGQMSAFMRRRREVARSLADVCVCGHVEVSELQMLLLEFIPPQEVREGTGGYTGRESANAGYVITLPPSLLSWSRGGCRAEGQGVRIDEMGVCTGLWKIGALEAPACEEEAAVFYNGVLGRRSLSQNHCRPHVFDVSAPFFAAQGIRGGEIVGEVDESEVSGKGNSCGGNVLYVDSTPLCASLCEAPVPPEKAQEQEPAQYLHATVNLSVPAPTATTAIEAVVTAQVATEDDVEGEDCFVPDSEDEEAQAAALDTGALGMVAAHVSPAGSGNETGGQVLTGLVAGEELETLTMVEESNDEDKGMLSQLLLLMSGSEDEDADGESEAPEEWQSEASLHATHAAVEDCTEIFGEENGGQGKGGGKSASDGLPRLVPARPRSISDVKLVAVWNGGSGGQDVLALVQHTLLHLSPCARATAKVAIELAVGAAIEVRYLATCKSRDMLWHTWARGGGGALAPTLHATRVAFACRGHFCAFCPKKCADKNLRSHDFFLGRAAGRHRRRAPSG